MAPQLPLALEAGTALATAATGLAGIATIATIGLGYMIGQTPAVKNLVDTLATEWGESQAIQLTDYSREVLQRNTEQQQAKTAQDVATAAALDSIVATSKSTEEVEARTWNFAEAIRLGREQAQAYVDAQTAAFTKAETEAKAKEAEASKVVEGEAEKEAEVARVATAAAVAEAEIAAATAAAVAGVTTPRISGSELVAPLTGASLAAVIPMMANAMAKSSHQQGIACMQSTGAAIIQGVVQTALPAAAAALFMVSPAIQDLISSFAQKAVSMMIAPMEKQAPITPDKAPGIGAYLLSQAVVMGAGAHLTSVTAEASAPLKNMGLGYLAAFMSDMAGFSRIAAAFQGQMINWGLMQPMRYYSLDKFRPMVPDPRLLMDMSLKREITDAQFNRGMGYAGFPEEWIKAFHRYKWRDPRLFEVLWIADVTQPDPNPPPQAVEWLTRANMKEWIGPDWWYAMKFAKAGYDPIDLPVLAKVTKRRTMATARTRRLFTTRQLYREGYVNEDFIRGQFIEMGEPEEAAAHWVIAERQERAYYLTQDMKALYLAQFTKGLIDEDDLKLVLSTIIVDPDFLSITMEKAITGVTPKVAKEEPPDTKKLMRDIQSKYIQAYAQLYQKEQIDEDTLYNYLIELKVDPGLAEATVTLESYKKIPKPEKVKPAELTKLKKDIQAKYTLVYIELYRRWQIEKDELLAHLDELKVDPELALATVMLEETKRPPRPEVVIPPDIKALEGDILDTYQKAYIELFRKNAINEEELLAYLVEQKVDPALAEATVTLESYKKIPKPKVVAL